MSAPIIAPITMDLFARLVAQFPTFDGLKTYLTSLNIQTNAKEGDPLVIFRYTRPDADLTNPVVAAFRSVIWDSVHNRPVFVAPQKSMALPTLPADFGGCLVEDFVDGVMVNVFFDRFKGTWRLATRSRLDADNKFYSDTFAEMFLNTWNMLLPGQGFGGLTPSMGYSFVLQHPSNRIVVPVAAPTITCVEVSMLDPNGLLMVAPAPVEMFPPRRFTVATPTEALACLASLDQFEGIRSQGIVVRDVATGRRWKMRTQSYLAVRTLRGNHSRAEYTWFDNLKKGTMEQYLTVYPEDRANSAALVAEWSRVVSEIYNWYVHVFKVRDATKDQIPPHYKGILFDIHGHYLKKLAPQKQSLTWAEHQTLMAGQDLKRMVFLTTFKVGSPAPPAAVKSAAAAQARAEAKAVKAAGGNDASMDSAAVPAPQAAQPPSIPA